MQTLDSFLIKKNKLPSLVDGISMSLVNRINGGIVKESQRLKATMDRKNKITKRGNYNQLNDQQRYDLAKSAHKYSSATSATKSITHHHLNASVSSVRNWQRRFEKAIRTLGREPKNAHEAGLIQQKRGPKSLLGEYNKSELVKYMKSMRESGADINKWTICALIKSYYKHTNQSNKL